MILRLRISGFWGGREKKRGVAGEGQREGKNPKQAPHPTQSPVPGSTSTPRSQLELKSRAGCHPGAPKATTFKSKRYSGLS